jgi:nitrous oxidase accessory protein NosD
VGNRLISGSGVGLSLELAPSSIVDGNFISSGQHGIVVDVSSSASITNNLIGPFGTATTNTYDGIILSGDSNRNLVQGNHLVPQAAGNVPRYGVNVSAAACDDTIVVGNDFGPAANYGTDALNDAGTGTILTYPNDATYGDNFT